MCYSNRVYLEIIYTTTITDFEKKNKLSISKLSIYHIAIFKKSVIYQIVLTLMRVKLIFDIMIGEFDRLLTAQTKKVKKDCCIKNPSYLQSIIFVFIQLVHYYYLDK